MMKTLVLLVAGLCAGLALAWWWQPEQAPLGSAAPAATAVAPRDVSSRADDGRLAALEAALAAETAERAALDERVAELAAALESLERPALGARRDADAPPGFPDAATVAEVRERVRREAQRSQVERLVDAGFSPDRAEWINRRTQELRVQALQAQYEATRQGRELDRNAAFSEDRTLRSELGDADYERYLKALNRPTSVPIMQVLASSPAERSGLKPGDELVAYDGKRIFDVREMNALTLEGTAGESVTIDVRRNGQTVQLVVPRGPLGVTAGGGGGPMRVPPPGR